LESDKETHGDHDSEEIKECRQELTELQPNRRTIFFAFFILANQSAPPREKLESDEKSHADHDSEEIKGRAPELTELQPPSIHFFLRFFQTHPNIIFIRSRPDENIYKIRNIRHVIQKSDSRRFMSDASDKYIIYTQNQFLEVSTVKLRQV